MPSSEDRTITMASVISWQTRLLMSTKLISPATIVQIIPAPTLPCRVLKLVFYPRWRGSGQNVGHVISRDPLRIFIACLVVTVSRILFNRRHGVQPRLCSLDHRWMGSPYSVTVQYPMRGWIVCDGIPLPSMWCREMVCSWSQGLSGMYKCTY